MTTYALVMGRPSGTTATAQPFYVETATVDIVRVTGAACSITTRSGKEYTVEMSALDFIALIGGTVTPTP